MTTLNLTEAGKLLGFKSPSTLRRLYQSGVLSAYVRSGPDKRAVYLETHPKDRPSLKEWVQAHVQFHPASPIWRHEPLPETVSDEALDAAMEPINEWIEGRADQGWEASAAAFIDNSCWGPPPWSAQEWRDLKTIIDLAEDG